MLLYNYYIRAGGLFKGRQGKAMCESTRLATVIKLIVLECLLFSHGFMHIHVYYTSSHSHHPKESLIPAFRICTNCCAVTLVHTVYKSDLFVWLTKGMRGGGGQLIVRGISPLKG